MHALLAHAYHLALVPFHLAARPVWRPLGACLLIALGGRVIGGLRNPLGAAMVAGAAVLAGSLVLAPPSSWPLAPVARLAGLAAIVLGEAVLRAWGWRPFLPLAAASALGAWWLRGAPLAGPAIANCMPVLLGLLAGLPLARRLARGDRGWATAAAAASLAGGLAVTGAAPHWVWAAAIPALVAICLTGLAAAPPVLAGMIVMVSTAALVASDRGRLVPVDAACLAPLLAWLLVPRFVVRVRW